MTTAYVSMGSNIEPQKHIQQGLQALAQIYGELVVSSVYESQAVGFEGDNFLNLVVSFETETEPVAIDEQLKHIEQQAGRERGEEQFVARSLDLDLLVYNDLVIINNKLSLPRDEILKYAFVLLPLAEIAPQRKHPVERQTYAALWQQFPNKEQQPLWKKDIQFSSIL